MAGNPTLPAGAFLEAFTTGRAGWHTLTISASDSPNLMGLDLKQLLLMDPAMGGPLDDNLYSC